MDHGIMNFDQIPLPLPGLRGRHRRTDQLQALDTPAFHARMRRARMVRCRWRQTAPRAPEIATIILCKPTLLQRAAASSQRGQR